MGFDRSKYTNRVIKQEQKEIQTIGLQFEKSEYAPVLYCNKLPKGKIIMNILPPHNPELGYYQQCSTSMLDVEKKDKDNNVTIGKKSIFSGEVHSNSGRCIIKEYIQMAERIIKAEETDAKAIQDKMDKLYGSFERKVNGITPSTTYAMYVYLSGNSELPKGDGVYKLMANYTIKSRLVDIQNTNQEPDQPLTVDIFTSPEDGVTLELAIDPKASGKDKYKVEAKLKRVPVPDEAYEYWDGQKSLESLYVDSYTSKDFDLAIEGLKRFDDESGFGLFGMEEFLDICSELSELYPNPEMKKIEDDKETAKNTDLPFGNPKEDMPKDDLPFDAPPAKSPSKTLDDNNKKALLDKLRANVAS